MTERLLFDVFPAEVLLNDGTFLKNVRAFVTDKKMTVWREDKIKGVGVVYETDVTETSELNGRIEVFGLGHNAIINKGRGCGCNSKLKYIPRPAELAGV